MKMPLDSKLRTQLLILLGIGAIVACILFYFGLSTLLTQRADTRLKLEDARARLAKIDREIRAFPDLRQSRDNLFWSIQQAATNYILFHEYRNYHLTAREIVLPLAAEMGITLDVPREGAVADLPMAESKSTARL